MAVLNYTTTIATAKTVGEVTELLVTHGVASVSTHYDEGRVTGLAFTQKTPHGPREFYLPVNVGGMLTLLISEDRAGKFKGYHGKAGALTTPEHAERVAWRVVKDWLEAQLTLVDASMATLDQVMLPYLVVGPGKTLYEAYRESEQAALTV